MSDQNRSDPDALVDEPFLKTQPSRAMHTRAEEAHNFNLRCRLRCQLSDHEENSAQLAFEIAQAPTARRRSLGRDLFANCEGRDVARIVAKQNKAHRLVRCAEMERSR